MKNTVCIKSGGPSAFERVYKEREIARLMKEYQRVFDTQYIPKELIMISNERPFMKSSNFNPDFFISNCRCTFPNVQNIKKITKHKKIVFNDPATIVIWRDGTKTIVKCTKGEVFNKEKGILMAYFKKFSNMSGTQLGKFFDGLK